MTLINVADLGIAHCVYMQFGFYMQEPKSPFSLLFWLCAFIKDILIFITLQFQCLNLLKNRYTCIIMRLYFPLYQWHKMVYKMTIILVSRNYFGDSISW